MGRTVYRVLQRAEEYLKKKGIEDAGISAAEILRKTLGYSRSSDLFCAAPSISSVEARQYHAKLRQRAARQPLQYITGEAGFYSLDLMVSPGVLIPRPETEILIERVIEILGHHAQSDILELGTGSGNIAISLATELKQVRVTTVDISRTALECARANARSSGVTDRIIFFRGDLFSALPAKQTFDLIISNPPYISADDIAGLAPEVRHEPLQALVGGADGLDFYRAMCAEARTYLKAGGFIAFEIGAGQAACVRRIMAVNGFESIKTYPDLLGRDRVLIGYPQ
jgi:release factor glutamine methyltransferase